MRLRKGEPRPVGEMLVRYSAQEMPVEAIAQIQHQTVKDLNEGEISPKDALRVLNLLLTVSLQKHDAVSA